MQNMYARSRPIQSRYILPREKNEYKTNDDNDNDIDIVYILILYHIYHIDYIL